VRVHVSRLRKALTAGAGNGADALVVTREHDYQLKLDPERLDSHRFERLVAEGGSELATGSPDRAALALEAEAYLLVDQGATYYAHGLMKEARACADDALGLSREAMDPAGIADALLGLATLDMAESHRQRRRRGAACA
jgi:hypothetical protein